MPLFETKRNEKTWITLGEASALTPYDSNYLGLLVRKKRLKARKEKGIWLTTRSDVEEYLDNHGEAHLQAKRSGWKNTVLVLVFLLPILSLVGIGFEVLRFWTQEGGNTPLESAVHKKAFVGIASTDPNTPTASFFETDDEVRVSIIEKKTP